MREYYFSCAHKQVKEIRSIRYNISYVCERIFATALTDWLRAEGSYVDTEEEPCDSSFFYAALAYWGSQEPDQWDREKEAWIEELKTL
jgi:hypothetical protein